MDDAREEAKKSIEEMYDAEREAEKARLEAAAAKATLEAVRKTKEMESFAKKEAKIARKEARIARKEARKKARAAKRALQDSLLGTGPKSYLTMAFGQPIIVGQMLKTILLDQTLTLDLVEKTCMKYLVIKLIWVLK